VNGKTFTVVDRQQLELIRAEQNFQFSGEADDNPTLGIGRFIRAQTIVSGTVSPLESRYRMTVLAIDVQAARGSANTTCMAAGGAKIARYESAQPRLSLLYEV